MDGIAMNGRRRGNSGFPSRSPDGKEMVFRFWSETEYGLRIINLDDGTVTKLTTGSDNFPAWSPKGDLIAFTRFSEDDYVVKRCLIFESETGAAEENMLSIWRPYSVCIISRSSGQSP